MVDENPDDASQTNVGLQAGADRGLGSRSTLLGAMRDAEIMRENAEKYKGYAGATRMLMSTATAEWVSAPTEMKFTPVSA